MRKIFSFAIVAGLFAAGAASAADRPTDMDYLRANRCKGLAVGADASSFDSYLKVARQWRPDYILERGVVEQAKGARDARNANDTRKAKYAADLAGPCQAFRN